MKTVSSKELNKLRSMDSDVPDDDSGDDEDTKIDFDEFKQWLDGKTAAPCPSPESKPSSLSKPDTAAASCSTKDSGDQVKQPPSSSSAVETTGTGVAAMSGHLQHQ